MSQLSDFWHGHGTKLLGTVTAVLGGITTLDPVVLASMFGAKAQSIAVTVAGILTFLRGFTNSKNNSSS